MQRFVIFLHKARSVTPDVAAKLGVAGFVEKDEVCKRTLLVLIQKTWLVYG